MEINEKDNSLYPHLSVLSREIDNAEENYDFENLVAKNAKYFAPPFLEGKGVVTVMNKNIKLLDISWPNQEISFCFVDCVIETVRICTNKTYLHKCKISNMNLSDFAYHIQVIECKIKNLQLKGNAQFKNAYLLFSKIENIKIDRTQLQFNDIFCEKVEFDNISDLKKVKLGTNVHFNRCSFKLNGIDKYESEFRHLKKEAVDQKNETLANFFAAREIKSRYHKQTLIRTPYEKVFGFFYWAINDFGLRPYLPLFYLFSIFNLICFFDKSEYRYHNAFTFLITPLKILNKDLHYIGYSIFQESLLSILGALFWFFFILGLRKIFKVEKV